MIASPQRRTEKNKSQKEKREGLAGRQRQLKEGCWQEGRKRVLEEGQRQIGIREEACGAGWSCWEERKTGSNGSIGRLKRNEKKKNQKNESNGWNGWSVLIEMIAEKAE